MADNIKIPPKFNELNFSIWNVKMTILLQSLGSHIAKAITKLYVIPPSDDEDTWSVITVKKFEANTKAYYALLQALNDDDISRVINYKLAFEI